MNNTGISTISCGVSGFSGASGTSNGKTSIPKGWSGSINIDEERLSPLGLYCKSGGYIDGDMNKKTYCVYSRDGTMTYSEEEFKNLHIRIVKELRIKKLNEIESKKS